MTASWPVGSVYTRVSMRRIGAGNRLEENRLMFPVRNLLQ